MTQQVLIDDGDAGIGVGNPQRHMRMPIAETSRSRQSLPYAHIIDELIEQSVKMLVAGFLDQSANRTAFGADGIA
jgi:hypothetical protein